MIDQLFSKNMHLHTERKGSYFPKNSINEISQRYNFAMVYCDKQNILEIGPGSGNLTNAILENAQRQLANTVDGRNSTTIQQNNAVDARSTQNNTTVLNQAPMSSTYDGFDRMAPI